MNEKTVLKSSIYVFLVGCLGLGLLSLFIQNISYILGFILGYIINIIVFLMIMKMSEGILKFSMSTAIIAVMFLAKLALGYMVTKVTIYVEGFIHKGGEVDA